MPDFTAHELSELRQKQMVADEVRRREWPSHELTYDPKSVREALKNDRKRNTVRVQSRMP